MLGVDYIFNTKLNNIPNKAISTVRIVTFNVHGYTDKNNVDTRDDIAKFLITLDADFICLQEHQGAILNINNMLYVMASYEIFQLVIYYKNANMTTFTLNRHMNRPALCIMDHDMLLVNTHLSVNLNTGYDEMEALLNELNRSYHNKKITICGDLNAYSKLTYNDEELKTLIKIKTPYVNSHSVENDLFKTLDLLQKSYIDSFTLNKDNKVINTTRFGGVVDYILFNHKCNVTYSNVFYTNFSDHLPVICDYSKNNYLRSNYIARVIGANFMALCTLHNKYRYVTKILSANKYGDTWFSSNNGIVNIDIISTYYKSIGFLSMNTFIGTNTVGDLTEIVKKSEDTIDYNNIIRCVEQLVESFVYTFLDINKVHLNKQYKYAIIIISMIVRYVDKYIKLKKQNYINEQINKNMNALFNHYFNNKLQYFHGNYQEHNKILCLFYNDSTKFIEFLTINEVIPVENFLLRIQKNIDNKTCKQIELKMNHDKYNLLQYNILMNKFILRMPRHDKSFVVYRSISSTLATYYMRLSTIGTIIPIPHLQSTALIPVFDHMKVGYINIMLEIHVPPNFPFYGGYTYSAHSMENSEIVLPYCDTKDGLSLSYGYQTIKYETIHDKKNQLIQIIVGQKILNEHIAQIVVNYALKEQSSNKYKIFDSNNLVLYNIPNNLKCDNSTQFPMLVANDAGNNPAFYKTCITHYITVRIVKLIKKIPVKNIDDVNIPFETLTADKYNKYFNNSFDENIGKIMKKNLTEQVCDHLEVDETDATNIKNAHIKKFNNYYTYNVQIGAMNTKYLHNKYNYKKLQNKSLRK